MFLFYCLGFGFRLCCFRFGGLGLVFDGFVWGGFGWNGMGMGMARKVRFFILLFYTFFLIHGFYFIFLHTQRKRRQGSEIVNTCDEE